ncbi:hypothetical protein SAMN03080617_03366 [Algoriphagus alkaliphilus]|uniref:Uncharacterized protein n=1 Tax=Algoriphagus alkaliphilus TaxID=279824 RepID=A0A1G5Z8S6_9BACT|nr:hypothetical protein SAMN03080617_03366 [Algoriphagus alkaliphilus]
MKKHILLYLLLLCTTGSLLAQERHGPYKIHKFVDGDTFWAKVNPGKQGKNQLLQFDLLKSVRFVNIFLNL